MKTFPDLKRIIYLHDILDHPRLCDIIDDHGLDLVECNVREVLRLNKMRLPDDADLKAVPGKKCIWVRREDEDNTEFQFTLAFDRACEYLTNSPEFDAKTGRDRDVPWQSQSLKKVYKVVCREYSVCV